jgi:hypothetical protein
VRQVGLAALMRAAPLLPRRRGLLAEMDDTEGAERKRSQIRVENITRRSFFARLDVGAARATQRSKALEHTFQENCGTWWRERRAGASNGFGRRRSALPFQQRKVAILRKPANIEESFDFSAR